MTMPSVDLEVAMEVISHEAIIRQAYKDSVGKWTWSVGLTSATGHNVSRYIGKPAPLQHCINVYVWALKSYAEQVKEAFAGCELTHAQFAAAVSFHWNTGAIKRASWVKKFKAGDIANARADFMAYNKPKEIIPRRRLECALFFDGKWSNDGTCVEYTRLTRKSTPDWGSAKRISVFKELSIAFAVPVIIPTLDTAPQPDAPVATPTLSPPPELERVTPKVIPVAIDKAPDVTHGDRVVGGIMFVLIVAAIASFIYFRS